MNNPDIRKTVEELLKREGADIFVEKTRGELKWVTSYKKGSESDYGDDRYIHEAYVTRLEAIVRFMPELVNGISTAIAYLESTGIQDLKHRDEPEHQMLICFKEDLANLQRVLGGVGK